MKKGLVSIISGLVGIAIGVVGAKYLIGYEKKTSKESKFRNYYTVLNQWMKLTHEGVNLEKYFIDNGMKKIAIYGMGELGERLLEELKDTSIELMYGIDKMGGYACDDFEIFSLEDDLKVVDAIIVTAIFDFDSIEKELSKTTNMKIISLEEVVFEIG